MTKALEEAVAQIRRLPEEDQDVVALVLMRYLAVTRYSDAEIQERFRTISLGQLDERMRRLVNG